MSFIDGYTPSFFYFPQERRICTESYGRKNIYANVSEITQNNVIDVLSKAVPIHCQNAIEISNLYDYYCGKQDICHRIKEVRPEINNKITVNICREIVSFYTGYILSEPVQYIASQDPKQYGETVATLNRLMTIAGRSQRDKELFDWLFIAGVAYRIAVPHSTTEIDGMPPFEIYTLDPRECFVIKSADFSHKPIGCVFIGHDDDNVALYNIWAGHFKCLVKKNEVIKTEYYPFDTLPITEYTFNFSNIGIFENILSLQNEYNNLTSDRANGVEQFIQSLLVFYNAEFEDDTQVDEIRQKGMIFLKSVGDFKADLKIIAEQLDQTQSQVFADDIRQKILNIVGMPSTGNGNTSDSSNNGAVVLKNGWRSAETNAKGIEAMFVEAENRSLRLILEICSDMGALKLNPLEVSVKMPRRNYEDSNTKATVFSTLANTGLVHPHQLYNICASLFADVEEAYQEGMEWFREYGKLISGKYAEDTEPADTTDSAADTEVQDGANGI